MIDLHTHSLFSDGELVPSELVRRAAVMGYRAIAITDHVDISNIEVVVSKIVAFAEKAKDEFSLEIIPGAEITHAPLSMIPMLIQRARELGARLVVVHGETIVEPVIEGTNRAAIEACVDILAHPGLITAEDVQSAVHKGVALEITARKGHSLSNGHVARLATKYGAQMVINTDAHSPTDLITYDFAYQVLRGAGLQEGQIKEVFKNSEDIVKKTSGGRI